MAFTTPDARIQRPVENWLMKSNMKTRIPVSMSLLVLSIASLVALTSLQAQAPSRIVGTITAIDGAMLTVKTDGDGERQVQVPQTAAVKRIAPGQKDLSTADAIQFSDLAPGDRVLVKLDPESTGTTPQALQIVAVKKTDLAAKQQKDREDWQKRGVGGLVKSVDAPSGVIVLSSGTGATAKTVTVHTTKATILKRYAPASVSFDAAQLAPIDAIHAGDQLRARGAKNPDGTEIAAEELVSGTFRNISGTISSLDTAASTLVVKDLATKKVVTIHISADAQMRRLPDRMALMLAARLKGTTGGTGSAWSGGAQGQNASSAGQGRGGTGQYSAGAGQGGGGGQWTGQGSGQAGGGGGFGDPQQMLSRLPAIQLADLKKGEAVMLVSTDGTTDVTGITLLAGVEPLLEAPAASSMLNSWSLGTGAPDAAAQ
jgi:hypothetical protein